MKTNFAIRFLMPVLIILAGCTSNSVAGQGRSGGRSPFAKRRLITGSNIPQRLNRPTFAPVSYAPLPVDSFANKRGSLVPENPSVGAGNGSSNY